MKRAGYHNSLFQTAMCLFVLFYCLTVSPNVGIAQEYVPDALEVQPETFDPVAGQQVRISFNLSAPAAVTTTIFDANHFLIKTLENNRQSPPGHHVIHWDGRDKHGLLVPADAYYFTLKIVFDDGRHFFYNPAFSGGKDLGGIDTQVDRQQQRVTYHLPEPARIRIRAGVKGAALRKTLIDWDAQTGGDHAILWDGMDESGTEIIWDQEGFMLSAIAFSLPPHSILVSTSQFDYFEYWRQRAQEYDAEMWGYIRASADAREARLRFQEVSEKVLQRTDLKNSRYYLMGRFLNRTPEVNIVFEENAAKVDGGIPVVSGIVPVNIMLSDLSRMTLLEQRYEVICYVDHQMVLEDESGRFPYTWLWDTTGLSNGTYLITVNIATLSDQVGVATTKVAISN